LRVVDTRGAELRLLIVIRNTRTSKDKPQSILRSRVNQLTGGDRTEAP
jgi:hypothetical protein